VAQASKNAGPPIWDVVETYLKAQKVIKPVTLNNPTLQGMAGNPGLA
jgi:S-sulfosulfanyl-L-cysteine sulfohydrolase